MSCVTHTLSFSRLLESNHPDFAAFLAIYSEALPLSEQKPREALVTMLARRDYIFLMAHAEGVLCGFSIAYVSTAHSYYLLEYMAIAATSRNRGFGAQLYRAMRTYIAEMSAAPRCAVLEVDAPDQECEDQAIRQRRVAFYERCGAEVVTGLDYLLPMECNGPPPAMRLMLDGEHPGNEALCAWLADMFVHVYQRRQDDKRLLTMYQQLGK